MDKKKKELDEIIKKGVEKDMSRFDCIEPITDEEMKNSLQELPPEDMLEKIKKKASETKN